MIDCIGMIHPMQLILMIYPIGYQVIQLLLIWHQRLHYLQRYVSLTNQKQ